MQTTADFIQALKIKFDLKSNYAVAKFLEQNDTTIARWAKGKVTFSDEMAMEIADHLGLEQAYVVACMHAERAKHTAEKKLWEKIATQAMAMAAMLSVIAFLPGITLPQFDIERTGLPVPSDTGFCILCQIVFADIIRYWYVLIPLATLALWHFPRYHPAPAKEAEKI